MCSWCFLMVCYLCLLSCDLFFQWFSAILFICTHDRWFQVAIWLLSPWSQDGHHHGYYYAAAMARYLSSFPDHFGRAAAPGCCRLSPLPHRGLQWRSTWCRWTAEVSLQSWLKCKSFRIPSFPCYWKLVKLALGSLCFLALAAIYFRVPETVSIAQHTGKCKYTVCFIKKSLCNLIKFVLQMLMSIVFLWNFSII